jgi:membrane protein DedA with SNARE-associated domain
MTLNEAVTQISEFVKHYQNWVAPLTFLLAFGESLAFISLFIPATVLLLAMGLVIGQAEIAFLPVWLAAIAGAYLGDWVSYFVGYHYKERVGYMWPLNRRPELLARGHNFFERWGVLGVFIGRFFGPLRAIVPLVAGICAMDKLHFQITNVTSAVAWATLMLAPGVFGLPMFFN